MVSQFQRESGDYLLSGRGRLSLAGLVIFEEGGVPIMPPSPPIFPENGKMDVCC